MQPRNNKSNAAATTERIYGVYIRSMLTSKIAIPITAIGKNIKQNLEKIISERAEGKCIPEGFVKPQSIQILTYSSGNVMGQNVEFCVTYECLICNPVEGMIIDCMTKTITKAGIHAEVVDEKGNVPITIFVARDHHYQNQHFNEIKENERIQVRVIGVRYELNDTYISVISKLIDPKSEIGHNNNNNTDRRKHRGGSASMDAIEAYEEEGDGVGIVEGGDDAIDEYYSDN
jgi:DNA-directed RNA polymerase subunit E'/Rpb7